jgi:hypothetical protein
MLEKKRREKIRDLYWEQDRIDEKRDELQRKSSASYRQELY